MKETLANVTVKVSDRCFFFFFGSQELGLSQGQKHQNASVVMYTALKSTRELSCIGCKELKVSCVEVSLAVGSSRKLRRMVSLTTVSNAMNARAAHFYHDLETSRRFTNYITSSDQLSCKNV